MGAGGVTAGSLPTVRGHEGRRMGSDLTGSYAINGIIIALYTLDAEVLQEKEAEANAEAEEESPGLTMFSPMGHG